MIAFVFVGSILAIGFVASMLIISVPLGRTPSQERRTHLKAIAAMKMAMRRGVDPYNSQPAQAKAWDWIARMQGGTPVRNLTSDLAVALAVDRAREAQALREESKEIAYREG